MFIAVDKERNLVLADHFTSDMESYCPSCGEEVLFRKGMINQAHFAHKSQSLCQSFSESETAAHLEGKLMLFEWFKKESIPVQLEAFLPDLNQRPDLLIEIKGEKIAIEYQCSPISKKKIRSRTAGYLQSGMKVIWVLGENLRVNKKLSTRHVDYISVNNKGNHCLFQIGDKYRQIDILTDINSSRRGITYERSSIHFADSIFFLSKIYERDPQARPPVKENRSIEERYLSRLSFYKNSNARSFFELMYIKKMCINTLPDSLFYTLSHEWLIKTMSYHWKLLVILWINELKPYQVITEKSLSQRIKGWEKDRTIHFHSLPGLDNDSKVQLVKEYLDVLCLNGFVREVGDKKWVRIKAIV